MTTPLHSSAERHNFASARAAGLFYSTLLLSFSLSLYHSISLRLFTSLALIFSVPSSRRAIFSFGFCLSLFRCIVSTSEWKCFVILSGGLFSLCCSRSASIVTMNPSWFYRREMARRFAFVSRHAQCKWKSLYKYNNITCTMTNALSVIFPMPCTSAPRIGMPFIHCRLHSHGDVAQTSKNSHVDRSECFA